MTDRRILIYNVIFGIFLILGGFMGFVTADSVESLASGLVFGNLMILSMWGIAPDKRWGHALATLLSVGLVVLFVLRLLKGAGPMPAVPVLVLSTAAIFANVYALNAKAGSKPDNSSSEE
jgi:uncharacterized membrane protein (UPF0136 family)